VAVCRIRLRPQRAHRLLTWRDLNLREARGVGHIL